MARAELHGRALESRRSPAAFRRRLARLTTWRVCLSHTSDLSTHMRGRSFVDAAAEGVRRAGHALRDMGDWTARDTEPAHSSIRMVEESDVYLGIIGPRCGSVTVVDGREMSFTELEYETATMLGLPRLMFLLDVRCGQLHIADDQSPEQHARQQAFRQRLEQEKLTIAHVSKPADLKLGVFQALVELRDELVRSARR